MADSADHHDSIARQHEHRQENSDACHGHDHNHGDHVHGMTRGQEVAGVSDQRLLWCVVLNQLLTVGQAAAGFFSGSVALLSDAAHNFNDANALMIAWLARRISRRSANESYTFGYRRAELIGATINLTLLAVIGLFLLYEGVKRLIYPQPILGEIMAGAAMLALIIDLLTVILLWSMSAGSMNVRAAFVHNLVDALGSLAVLVGAAAIIWFDWYWIDPVLTLLISGYVLWQVATLLPQAVRVLMEGTPTAFDLQDLKRDVEQLEHIGGMHHLHVWQLDEHHTALEAHIVIAEENVGQLEVLKQRIKQLLRDEYEITHSTLEFEFSHCISDPRHNCHLPNAV